MASTCAARSPARTPRHLAAPAAPHTHCQAGRQPVCQASAPHAPAPHPPLPSPPTRARAPTNTAVPSGAHALHSTGLSSVIAALGVACPLPATSQHSTWLFHEVATSRLEFGLNARLLMPSAGAEGTSTSLLGLWAACCPNVTLPKEVIAR